MSGPRFGVGDRESVRQVFAGRSFQRAGQSVYETAVILLTAGKVLGRGPKRI